MNQHQRQSYCRQSSSAWGYQIAKVAQFVKECHQPTRTHTAKAPTCRRVTLVCNETKRSICEYEDAVH